MYVCIIYINFLIPVIGYAVIQLPELAIYLYVWAKKSFWQQGLHTQSFIHSTDSTNINHNVISETGLGLKVTKYTNYQGTEYQGIQGRLDTMNERIDSLTVNFEHMKLELKKITVGMKVLGNLEI
jgi:hypothetical protein